MTARSLRSRCACGAVRFRVADASGEVVACHCHSCRRWSGHFWAALRVPCGGLVIKAGDGLHWWGSSEFAERGFCRHCGSSLFYRRHGAAEVAVAPGALALPTGLTMTTHIYGAEAGDYYALDDTAVFHPGSDGGGRR